ncbi:cell adhesion molecule CEACAM16-like [Podarcis muralis]
MAVLLRALTLAGLVSCLQLADAIQIVPTPSTPRVGQTVTLSVQGIRDPTICFWFRGSRFDKGQMIFQVEAGRVVSRGGGSTDRHSLGRDCALVIQGVQSPDAGEYYFIALHGRRSGQRWEDALTRLQVSN